jgi:hypothetical protein
MVCGQVYIIEPKPSTAMLNTKLRHRRSTSITSPQRTELDSQGVPLLSSKPGSSNILYIDVNGHVSNIENSWGAFSALAFSLDDDRSTFNREEQDAIADIWSRVSEDFSPFDIDVTTVRCHMFACFHTDYYP